MNAVNAGRFIVSASSTLNGGISGSGPIDVNAGQILILNQPAWSHAGVALVNPSANNSGTYLRFDQSCSVSNLTVNLNSYAPNLDTGYIQTLGPAVAARLEGKSSLGRLGLLTHSTAGFIDPGFSGHVTLELSNMATLPVKLWPGMKIGQLCFFRLSSPAEHPYGSSTYGSRYQGQRGPTASLSYRSFHRTTV